MSVRRIKNHGRWVWQARVAYKGLRRAAFRSTKDEARDAEAELLRALKSEHGQAEQAAATPATLKQLFEYYVCDLEARGKGPDTIGRAVETAHVVERLMPELLARPVSRIGDAELFAFRNARLRDGKVVRERVGDEVRERRAPAKASTINRDLRTLRAMLKKARPDYRVPAGVFLPEDETRVRWLRPEEELLVLDTMRSPFREIAKLAALTLMRLSEVRLLRREYVHLEQGVILLPQAKAGARPVILSGEAQKILRGQLQGAGAAAERAAAAAGKLRAKAREAGGGATTLEVRAEEMERRAVALRESEWVFPGPDGRPYERSYVGRVFRRAARAAGLRDFHFHDLRHHGATMALNKGFTAPIVMALGGWKTERMMRRYAAVTDMTLRAAAEAISGSERIPLERRG
jgi:integrase